jgi:signal transduction histidine kinase
MRALRGLRGRLLLALVATSAVTLAVAAAITLSPLQQRLRTQSAQSLQRAVVDSSGQFTSVLSRNAARDGAAGSSDADIARLQTEQNQLLAPAGDLKERTGARVLVATPWLTSAPGETWTSFLADTEYGQVSQRDALLIGLQAMQLGRELHQVDDQDLQVAMPLYGGPSGDLIGVLVADRPLTEVATAVHLVRNALLAAAGIGLAVAVALGLALSSTLTRRLGRLQRAALRITAEGPDAPAPRDRGRDEVGDLARALGRMQEELRRQESARRSFVATASHELRTPLTMLQGTMELLDEDLRDGADLDDAREQVAGARRELRRLSVLASELLDLSRLDAAVQLRSEPVELGEITRAVAAEFELAAGERSVELEVLASEEACWARADPAACARVVRILLDNALRYGPESQPIEIVTARDGGRVTVEVADRGPGVPKDERERIFERFHRGRSAGAQHGFGLGLAIGRELAERMNGTLVLAESPHGARFRLTLPATSGASSRTPSPAPDSFAAGRSSAAGSR